MDVVAAKIFQIIGIIALVIAIFVFIIILPIINRLLKGLNRTLGSRGRDLRGQMSSSLKEIEVAQGQLETVVSATDSVKSGMRAAIGAADKFVDFLKSPVFQLGLPVSLWFLLLAVAVPRGIRRHKKISKKQRVIPPPSWEEESR